jgi:hypothetical protein
MIHFLLMIGGVRPAPPALDCRASPMILHLRAAGELRRLKFVAIYSEL